MTDAGIRIAAGTDAGNTGTLHATSFINELNAMKKSGISNWQILQSATINPTYILGKEKETRQYCGWQKSRPRFIECQSG